MTTPLHKPIVAQGLTKPTWVFLRGNAGIHVVENFRPHSAVNTLQVSFNP
jgi:hypothetical protein